MFHRWKLIHKSGKICKMDKTREKKIKLPTSTIWNRFSFFYYFKEAKKVIYLF